MNPALAAAAVAAGADAEANKAAAAPAALKYVRRGEHLAAIPSRALASEALERLDLAHNAIAAVPPGALPALPNLRALDLSHNAITKLPDDIGALTCVTRVF
jgi:Leucine-rich repeat (LRR) protein